MSASQFSWPGRRAKNRAHDQLAAFLMMDVQRSPDWARDIVARIADVKTGALPAWVRVGNAYRLYLSAEGALIEDLVDRRSAPQRLPLAELEAALTAWIEAIG
jgi:hypothetical protein